MKKKLETLCENVFQEVVDIRRYLHKNPELSTMEKNTSDFVSEKLRSWGIPHQGNVGGHGIVATIEGSSKGTCIALRADMDALPIKEENSFEFASINHGVMHACGHDAHTANLLGIAFVLNSLKDRINGTIKLFFQASEECFPGGAIQMIEAGVLENPSVDYIIGMHVSPELKTGIIGMKPGMYMASTDEIYLTVKGKGGHAATPDKVNDPIIAASHILIGLQQIVSRNADPGIPTVLSFGRIEGLGRTNIIPDVVKVEGTLRTFDEQWRARAHQLIISKSKNIALANDCECEINIAHGYPFLVNDPEFTEKVFQLSADFLPEIPLQKLPLRMTAEDFAYFSQQKPSLFFRIGTGNTEKDTCYNLHTSKFNVDEDALKNSLLFMSSISVLLLNGELK